MSNLDYFDQIFCINLDSRPDRWNKVVKEFTRIGIMDRVKRIPGIIYRGYNDSKRNACVGNHLSHARCIKEAMDRGLENCLIFEDDVLFIDDTKNILKDSIKQLKFRDWRLYYLGVNIERPAYQVDHNLARLTFAYSTHAYAINYKLFEELFDINTDISVLHNDVYYNDHIINKYECYSCVPIVAIQQPSYSDIEEKEVNYDWMVSRFNSNLVRR